MNPKEIKIFTTVAFLFIIAISLYFYVRSLHVYQSRSVASENEVIQSNISRLDMCYGVQHCESPTSSVGAMCGECAGLGSDAYGCSKGYTCSAGSNYACIPYSHSRFGSDGLYPIDCEELSIVPKYTDDVVKPSVELVDIQRSSNISKQEISYFATIENKSDKRINEVHFMHQFLHKGDQWNDVTDIDDYEQANVLVEPKTPTTDTQIMLENLVITNASGVVQTVSSRNYRGLLNHNRRYSSTTGEFFQESGPAHTEFDIDYLEPGEKMQVTLTYDITSVDNTCGGLYKNIAFVYYRDELGQKYRSPFAIASLTFDPTTNTNGQSCDIDATNLILQELPPTPTPYIGAPIGVCTNPDSCGARPYYLLTEQKLEDGSFQSYGIRYYMADNERPDNLIFEYVANGNQLSDKTRLQFDQNPTSNGYYFLNLPYRYLYSIRVLPGNVGVYLSNSVGNIPPWTVKQDIYGSIEYRQLLRYGLITGPTTVPTITNTPTPSPTGFNLYLDPTNTDAERDAIELKLYTGVRQSARRGEVFTVRVVASPLSNNFANEYIHLREIKVPIQYALPVNPESIVIEGIQSTNNPECSDYDLIDPQPEEISTISAFYLKLRYVGVNQTKQLMANTCVAEVTFSVRNSAQYGDSASLKLLTAEESLGIADIDASPALTGMYALAYHLSRIPPTQLVATPASIHPKVNLSYDMQHRLKTIYVDTSRLVAEDAPDIAIDSAYLLRLASDDVNNRCGEVKLAVKVKNLRGSNTGEFEILANGQTKKSDDIYPTVIGEIAKGIDAQETRTYIFDRVYFNNEDVNTVLVDSKDIVIEKKEDNNYLEKKFVYADIPGNTNTNCPNPTAAPTRVPTPTSANNTPPPIVLDMSKVNLRMKVKVQGVNSSTFSNLFTKQRFGVSIGGGTLSDNTQFVYSIFEHRGAGVFEGVVTFEPSKVPDGTGYRVIIKGSKHLAKRFCAVNIAGDKNYSCPIASSNISLGTGVANLDYSAFSLSAGDLPMGDQDGVVDSQDLAFIRDNLGAKQPEIIKTGDLNMDGIIDTQDYSIVINNLISNEDEN
jgi:hypothetical protein